MSADRLTPAEMDEMITVARASEEVCVTADRPDLIVALAGLRTLRSAARGRRGSNG